MVDDIQPHIIGITESWANNDITDARTDWEVGEEECYYTSRTLYQHMKYIYRRKQIAMRPYGAN